MKIISYNIYKCNQSKIDHLLKMDADVYIVPEMSNPGYLNIPNEYSTVWVGDIDSKGLGVIWRNRIGGSIQYLISDELKYFIVVKTNKVFIVAVWPTKYGCTLKMSYSKLMMLAMEKIMRIVSGLPTIIAGDFNCYLNKNKGNNSILPVDEFLMKKGFKSIYHDKANESLGEETKSTYHHLFMDNSTFFIDYAYSNIQIKDFSIGEWERDISDHQPQLITI